MTDSSKSAMNKKSFWAPKHIALVKGLPFDSSTTPRHQTLNEVRELFGECGELKSITEQLDDKNKWTGCLYLKFGTEADMNRAIGLNNSIWNGTGSDGTRYVTVTKMDTRHDAKQKSKLAKLAAGKNDANKKNGEIKENTVLISNLHDDATVKDIKLYLFTTTAETEEDAADGSSTAKNSIVRDSAGSGIKNSMITSIKLAKDLKTSKCRGFCHVEFNSKEATALALKLNKCGSILGKVVTIRVPHMGIGNPSNSGVAGNNKYWKGNKDKRDVHTHKGKTYFVGDNGVHDVSKKRKREEHL